MLFYIIEHILSASQSFKNPPRQLTGWTNSVERVNIREDMSLILMCIQKKAVFIDPMSNRGTEIIH